MRYKRLALHVIIKGKDFYIYIYSFSTEMAATESEIHFRIQVWCQRSLKEPKEVEMYLQTKLRLNISIHGWHKTTSGFEKRTAATSEFYFRFPHWAPCGHRHVILHLPAKFRGNRTNGGRVMTSYRFFKMTAIDSEIYFWGSGLMTALI